MGVHVVIDDALVREAKAVTGQVSESAAIEEILKRVLAGRRRYRSILDLAGQVEFFDGYDPKNLRG
jgi:hypothetical protein